ncbi:MAG: hypothetical protein ISS66_05550 [Desulfobacteraceae bacterium]|nr:hypothetical protein [Desulfobacteraceae bacterium]
MGEDAAIIEILRSVGVYDFIMGKVKDEGEAISLFKDDFGTLLAMCQE